MTRTDPPVAAGERETLIGFIDYQRDTLAMKCDGLTPAQLMQVAAPPSDLTLIGLVRHLAEVERSWFQRRVADERGLPTLYCEQDRDGDFHLPDGDPQAICDEAFATWRAQIERSREILAAVPDLGQLFTSRHGELSVRWLLAHMLEEYARHDGHADLLREAIDGATGE